MEATLNPFLTSGNVHLYHLEVTLARGYKTFFMLNSAEHEILNAHKYKNRRKFSTF